MQSVSKSDDVQPADCSAAACWPAQISQRLVLVWFPHTAVSAMPHVSAQPAWISVVVHLSCCWCEPPHMRQAAPASPAQTRHSPALHPPAAGTGAGPGGGGDGGGEGEGGGGGGEGGGGGGGGATPLYIRYTDVNGQCKSSHMPGSMETVTVIGHAVDGIQTLVRQVEPGTPRGPHTTDGPPVVIFPPQVSGKRLHSCVALAHGQNLPSKNPNFGPG